MFKDEVVGKIINEFVGLQSKLYAYNLESEVVTNENEENKKCKGVKKIVVKNEIKIEYYKKKNVYFLKKIK